MIGTKEVERHQRMTPDEKIRELAALKDLPPEERKRRWEAWEREDQEASRLLAERLACRVS